MSSPPILHVCRRLVLPGLRKLTWIARKPQTVGQILCLVSVSVKSLDLRVQGGAAVNEINDLFPELALQDLTNPNLLLRPVFNQPSLRRLRLGAWIPFGSEVLLSLQNLPQLRALQIRPGLSLDVGTKELFSKLAENRDLLEELVTGLPSAGMGSRKTFDFSDIQPLLKLDKLKTLELHADLPLRLQSADVEAMAMAWQHIRSLSLCATVVDPSASGTMATPLGLLEAIAAALPTNLERFGSHFDCSQSLTNKKATKGFTSLQTLSVGNSTLVASKAKDVGKFIASLTPPGLRLIHSLPLAPDYPAFPDGLIANGSEAWLDVQRVVESSHKRGTTATRKIVQGWVNKALGGLGKSS
ncbi:hypothetical protein FRC04_002790 [Tulasnella sp. 424]|nr:hypothetical protein FRC04_002790 [Tulasnella sp. 424]KAG8966603.1 hypothetical protein FRC05_002479 [Tulasnella sp. 425]